LGDGIFETEGSLFKFPVDQDTSLDSLVVGDDKALAFGMTWGIDPPAIAENNLEIKKNQDSGDCVCCPTNCTDCCIKINLEQIKVGNREAMAFGFATATNNVKIVTNQQ